MTHKFQKGAVILAFVAAGAFVNAQCEFTAYDFDSDARKKSGLGEVWANDTQSLFKAAHYSGGAALGGVAGYFLLGVFARGRRKPEEQSQSIGLS